MWGCRILPCAVFFMLTINLLMHVVGGCFYKRGWKPWPRDEHIEKSWTSWIRDYRAESVNNTGIYAHTLYFTKSEHKMKKVTLFIHIILSRKNTSLVIILISCGWNIKSELFKFIANNTQHHHSTFSVISVICTKYVRSRANKLSWINKEAVKPKITRIYSFMFVQ